jgi:hypothetical protein
VELDYSRINGKIVGWSKETLAKLRARINELGIRHAANSNSPQAAERSLAVRTPKRDGMIHRVSYSMPRHMIFVHKGVGRGTKISQVGNTKREAKPWFNPVIEENIDELATVVAEEMGAEIVNKLLIR